MRSLLALPLTHPGTGPVLGALVLARTQPRPFTPAETTTARGRAALIALTLLTRALGTSTTGTGRDLDGVVDPAADLVPRAAGMLAHREQISTHAALALLRATAIGAG